MAATILIALLALAAPPTRSVVEAMPPNTTEALFLEPLGQLEPAMDALSSTLGGGFALSFAEVAALPNLVLQGQARNDPGAVGLNGAGGLGLFRMEGYPGAIGVVAVADELRAMDALVRKLRSDGAELLGSSGAGVELQAPGEAPVLAFWHRGFLYLAMPDPPAARRVNQGVSAAVKAAPLTGLGGTALWQRLSSRIDRRGSVVFFRRRPLEQVPDLQGLVLAARLEQGRIAVTGFAASSRPFEAGEPLEWRELLRNAPGHPAVVLSSHAGPELLQALALQGAGDPDGPWISSWLEIGPEAGALAATLGGGLDAIAYTRAGVAADEDEAWDAEGAILWEASLHDVSAAAAALRQRSRRRMAGADEAPWRLRIRDGVLSAALGPRPSGPPRDVLADLSERFGGGAFGPGHVSVYVDLPLVRESFLDAGAVPALLPRGDHLFLDAAPAPGGFSIRSELSLPGREEALGRR